MTPIASSDDFADFPEKLPSRRPPYDEAAEQSVLGAMMMDRKAIIAAQEFIDETAFYREAHRRIFRAMLELERKGVVVDALTLADQLTSSGELEASGGKDFLSSLIDVVPTAANVKYHAGIVRELSHKRRVIEACTEAIGEAFERRQPAKDIVQQVTNLLVPLAVDDAKHGGYRRIVAYEVMEELEKRRRGEVATGYFTGIRGLDARTHGYRKGEMVIIGAVAKKGKSVLAHQIARYNALRGIAAAVVSAEMSRLEIVERHASAMTRVLCDDIQAGTLRERDMIAIAQATARLEKAPLWIDDTARPSFHDIAIRAKALKADHPEVSLMVVDFLQLVQFPMKGRREDEELRAVAYGLKELAQKLDVVMIVPCQLNSKDVERRPGCRPEARDLQGTNAIQQAAHHIVLLYRASMYDDTKPPTMELIVPGNGVRRSAPFTVTAWWRGDTMRIENEAHDEPLPSDTQTDLPLAS